MAVFDFDGTITCRDTFRDIFLWRFGFFRFSLALLLTSPLIALYMVGLVRNDIPKVALFKIFFRGWNSHEYQYLCFRYAHERLPLLVRSKAIERIKWHQSMGHLLIINSASLADWITPWASLHGFSYVLACRAHSIDGILDGAFDGPCSHGKIKVVRLEELNVEFKDAVIYAYGDSKGDRELLSLADIPAYRSFHD